MASRSTFHCGVGAASFLLLGWLQRTPAGMNSGPELTFGTSTYHSTQSTPGLTYELVGRTLPTDPIWVPAAPEQIGSGGSLFFFEEGEGPDWLPSRAWSVSSPTDGFSLDFDGIADFAVHPHDNAFNFVIGMTLEAWVKPRSWDGTVIEKAVPASVELYRLSVTAAGFLEIDLYEPFGSLLVTATGFSKLPQNNWSHIAASYDGTTVKLFINGQPTGSQAAAGTVRVSSFPPVAVGGGGQLGSALFDGLMDEIRAWDIARSDAQILADHDQALAGSEPGLIAYWALREPGSSTATDDSGNGLHLTLGDASVGDSH